MPLRLAPTLRERLAANPGRALVGMWLCSGSPVIAEIAAGADLDLLLIDAEHSPLSLGQIQSQLQAIAAYSPTAAVRVPSRDPVGIKQILDLGVQNIVVPMVSSADEAREVVAAARYGPSGVRGVGSALARSGRWGRIADYLREADKHVSVTVQIETAEGVANAADIVAVEGVDAVFIGPSDLAASMGLIGQQTHREVVAAAKTVLAVAEAAGKPAGVNAFDPQVAQGYVAAGARFVLAGADVTMVAKGSDALAQGRPPRSTVD